MRKTIHTIIMAIGIAFAILSIFLLILLFIWRYSYISFPIDSIRITNITKTDSGLTVEFINTESGFYPNKLKLRRKDSTLYVWIGKGISGVSKQYKDIDEITVGNSMVRDCYYSFDLTLDNQIERVVLKGKEKEDSKVLWVTNKDV
ncbi:MAG: hypothetical protein IK133_00320 [Clostridia bacterium]|nr:hypothetical protein [Clostridia bacterium]